MNRFGTMVVLAILGGLFQPASAAEPAKLAWDAYSGYFVSNEFEPDEAESYLVIDDQETFDEVFGAAFVMNDTSHRLPKDAFQKQIVLAAVKRGSSFWEYSVEAVTEDQGVVQLRYKTVAKPSDTATFACPLIVSIPRGEYRAFEFVENKKSVKTLQRTAADEAPAPPTDQPPPMMH